MDVSNDEGRRLEAVRRTGLLDGATDPAIDALVAEIGQEMGRERAFFAVIDDASENVRYGSRDVRGALPRGLAISADAISTPTGRIVCADMRVDRRCGFDPRVVGAPSLRALAGIAIHAEGERIGVLCVADSRPGTLAPPEFERLHGYGVELERLVATHAVNRAARGLLARDIVSGLVDRRFHLVWQPIVSSDAEEPVLMEGLLRLRRADGTTAPPGDFLPLAEKTGLMRALDEQVVTLACRQLAVLPPALSLTINISPDWFEQSKRVLADVVQRAAAASGASPDRLVVEMTEQAMIADRGRAQAEIDALRSLGTRVALDDFGTGYSSLSYLAEFRFDLVKLDRSFLRRIDEDPRCHALVQATIALVHALGMPVCGEGVETASQLATLRDLGCDLLQGFHIGRPGPMG